MIKQKLLSLAIIIGIFLCITMFFYYLLTIKYVKSEIGTMQKHIYNIEVQNNQLIMAYNNNFYRLGEHRKALDDLLEYNFGSKNKFKGVVQ